MSENTVAIRRKDYSLTGRDSVLAVESGLADAVWYQPPIPKERLRELLERRDGPALRDTILWFALLATFGLGGRLLWGSWWAVLPFALYGIVYASSSDSRWHESGHGTAFRTDWMNNALYEIASFMVMRESVVWRWSHARHHSDTIIVGRDPEIAVPRPANLLQTVLKLVGVRTMVKYFRSVLQHAAGRLTPDEQTFIPASENGRVYVRARIYLLIYAAVIASALAAGSILPLMFIGLPAVYGSWLMVIYGLTQHAGLAENVLDHRLNTRTVIIGPIHRYLYWNMNYHIEHHLFPLVPYHNLPRLHTLVKTDLPRPYQGLLEAYREIIPTLLRQSRDASHFVRRPLPAARIRVDAAPSLQAVRSAGKPGADGWIEVCDARRLKVEDVLRFDHEGHSYAIYRTRDGKVYATGGICTHGNAQLAEGLVQGDLIECPKHNGRFDVRDGSPRRPPVCVPLQTYAVREVDGKLWFDLSSVREKAETERQITYTFRVVSNDNVATFIKELVLEPEEDSPVLTYRPGEYLQFDIPEYPLRTLADFEVPEPFASTWRSLRIFDLPAANPMACRRNYSLATNPAREGQVRLNVRLAVPPSSAHQGATPYRNAGAGSAYMFSLQRGDRVTATGPFGDFHIKDTGREMVYVGRGSGMSPLRSHLSYLFETLGTSRRVSFWYGARSQQDLYYRDYFEALARDHPNFTYRTALTAPEPGWDGFVGQIHDVLLAQYLSSHPDPASVEYYLCGPQAMMRAAREILQGLGVPPAQIAADEF